MTRDPFNYKYLPWYFYFLNLITEVIGSFQPLQMSSTIKHSVRVACNISQDVHTAALANFEKKALWPSDSHELFGRPVFHGAPGQLPNYSPAFPNSFHFCRDPRALFCLPITKAGANDSLIGHPPIIKYCKIISPRVLFFTQRPWQNQSHFF